MPAKKRWRKVRAESRAASILSGWKLTGCQISKAGAESIRPVVRHFSNRRVSGFSAKKRKLERALDLLT